MAADGTIGVGAGTGGVAGCHAAEAGGGFGGVGGEDVFATAWWVVVAQVATEGGEWNAGFDAQAGGTCGGGVVAVDAVHAVKGDDDAAIGDGAAGDAGA